MLLLLLLSESGDNCKGNDDIFKNYSRTVFCFVTSVEQGHNLEE